MKVTTPTTGLDTMPNQRQTAINDTTTIQNPIDLNKVTRGDGKNNTDQNGLSMNFDSNFNAFIELMRNTPDITEIFAEIFYKMGAGDIPQTKFTAELSNFLKGFQMSGEDLLMFVKNQAENATKFHGAFFQDLLKVLEKTKSSDLKRELGNFLKSYNDVASSGHILKNNISLLKNMVRYMPAAYRQGVEEFIGRLEEFAGRGENGPQQDIGANPQVTEMFKNEIIPFLSKYIKQTNHMGQVRDYITMFVLNVARYENGSEEKLEASLKNLLEFNDFRKQLPDTGLSDVKRMIIEDRQASRSEFSAQFTSMIQKGLEGAGGFETKTAFEAVLRSVLLNQSVYMPLMHFMVPAQLNGRKMFSEIWIDKDSQGSSSGNGGQGRSLLIKFDIEDVGFFDLILTYQNDSVDLKLYYPEELNKKEKNIRKDIGGIMEKNGLNLKSIQVSAAARPKKLEEVFPKLYERINTVNVKV